MLPGLLLSEITGLNPFMKWLISAQRPKMVRNGKILSLCQPTVVARCLCFHINVTPASKFDKFQQTSAIGVVFFELLRIQVTMRPTAARIYSTYCCCGPIIRTNNFNGTQYSADLISEVVNAGNARITAVTSRNCNSNPTQTPTLT